MKTSEKLEQLMEFIYDEYSRSETFQGYGEYPSVLVDRSGIRFGDARAQLTAIEHLIKLGWLEIISSSKSNRRSSVYFSQVRPTYEGILHVEKRRQPWLKKNWQAIYESTIAGVIKGFKR